MCSKVAVTSTYCYKGVSMLMLGQLISHGLWGAATSEGAWLR